MYFVLSKPILADKLIDRVSQEITSLTLNEKGVDGAKKLRIDAKTFREKNGVTHIKPDLTKFDKKTRRELKNEGTNNYLEDMGIGDFDELYDITDTSVANNLIDQAYYCLIYRLFGYRGTDEGSCYINVEVLESIGNHLNKYGEIYKRALSGVKVSCLSADRLLQYFHKKGVLDGATVYIDPPYMEAVGYISELTPDDKMFCNIIRNNFGKTSNTYSNKFNMGDTIALLGTLDSYCSKSKVIISNYNNKIIETYLTRSRHTWYRYKLADLRVQSSKTNSKSKYAEEYIYTNFKIE